VLKTVPYCYPRITHTVTVDQLKVYIPPLGKICEIFCSTIKGLTACSYIDTEFTVVLKQGWKNLGFWKKFLGFSVQRRPYTEFTIKAGRTSYRWGTLNNASD